ncbi:eCIS core domain-containing protein [Sphingosinicella terrae]|uniref:eCIS core domain-containing protein n=1 Tax=Sphingosinicella terrae TaxID=2172047 RepID=UPI000E0DF4EB|nr:DUF4157 domain-containing protein [Sphingosinicella terrae]
MAQHAAPVRAPPMKAPAAAAPVLQRKLEVGPAADHFEREADSVASSVMAGTSAPVSIPPTITPIGAQRKSQPVKNKEEEKKGKPPSKGMAQRKAAAPKRPEEEPKAPKAKAARAQRKAAPKPPEEMKSPKKARAQREPAAGAEGGSASAATDGAIQAMRSGLAPGLDGGTRTFMEGRFGRDLSAVRVHHGTEAARAADALGARAFTVGNDIFFNRGEYRPNSGEGRRLLAHELTHTVQQSGSGGTAARKRIQRGGPPPKAPEATPSGPTKEAVPADGILTFTLDNGGPNTTGKIKSAAGQKEVELPYLSLPKVNGALKGTTPDAKATSGSLPVDGTRYSITGSGTKSTMMPINRWLKGAREPKFQADILTHLNAKLPKAEADPKTPPANDPLKMPNGFYVLGFESSFTGAEKNTFIWGSITDLAQAQLVLAPRWSSRAGEATFEADHILETQLGGADEFDNLWLLDAGFNGSVGPAIGTRILSDLIAATKDVEKRYDLTGTPLPGAGTMRESWKLTFVNLREEKKFGTTKTFWTRQSISEGLHLKPIKFLTSKDLQSRGFRPKGAEGTPSKIYIFPTPNGGKMWTLNVGDKGELKPPGKQFFYPNMELIGGTLEPAGAGGTKIATIQVMWRKAKRTAKGAAVTKGGKIVREEVPKSVDLDRLPGFYDVGYISTRSVQDARTGWDLPGASPVDFTEFGLNTEGYLVGSGVLTATKALLPGLRADVVMLPTELRIDFPIPMEAFSLGPVTVTALSMSLGVNDGGPFLRGAADFMVTSLGEGSIVAEVGKAGPVISGDFNLAMDFLNPANVAVSYDFANDAFSAQATLGVQAGRIPGIESGQVAIGMSRDAVTFAGTLSLGGPLKGTVINVSYDKTTGLKIGADNIPLPLNDIPAIQNASLSISATRTPEGVWSFAGTGTATLAVPGATGTITISYLDGAITFTTAAQIAKGPASGTLNFTATNRALDEDGKPIEGPPTDTISVWGKGTVTIQFGKILTGTAGVELTPDNHIIISGSIGLPPVFELFPKKEYKKDLLTLAPPEFPIWGVSVAGVGIGIFAFVDATVAFNAFVGPGEIRNAQIGATMDLEKPEEATVTGHADVVVPAYAGLSLDVGGGLRARLAVAYAEGRVGLKGELGIEAGASAAIDIAWNKDDGLEVGADLKAEAKPKFELSANASVTVGVDLWVTDVSHTFGPWTKMLGTFGPDMTLGVRMPVKWSEAEGLDLDLEDIEVTKPSLDASALMSSVFDELAG